MALSCAVLDVLGDDNKRNFVYFRPPPVPPEEPADPNLPWLVFFPGDISDFLASRPPSRFPVEYGLELMMWILLARFPKNPIVLIRPKMLKDAFACYLNFLLVDPLGAPRSVPKASGISVPHATKHLAKLLVHLAEMNRGAIAMGAAGISAGGPRPVAGLIAPDGGRRVRGSDPSPPVGRDEHYPATRLARVPEIILAGFSKGHVVLNALLTPPEPDHDVMADVVTVFPGRSPAPGATLPTDQHQTNTDRFYTAIWSRVRQVHYLDPGLHDAGLALFPPLDAWRDFVRHVPQGTTEFFLHGTPRQLLDDKASAQWDQCVRDLKSLGVPLQYHRYYEYLAEVTRSSSPADRAKTLAMHFKVIEQFRVEGSGAGNRRGGPGLVDAVVTDVWSLDGPSGS